MGLSASQARLLTITARKSDCEFQSMRYSHEKIALSRSMTDVSNEYQNALNQTKLVYDFYGNGDVNTPLTYGLMMTPSELNGHMPILTTDASGKAVLNSQYAAAARAAGIPQEGLGCLPSSDVRNKFLQGLADNGLISHEAAKTYMGIEYSQGIGLGSTDLVTTKVEQMTLEEMLNYYQEQGALSKTGIGGGFREEMMWLLNKSYGYDNIDTDVATAVIAPTGADVKNTDFTTQYTQAFSNVTIVDILKGDYNLFFACGGDDDMDDGDRWNVINNIVNQIGSLSVWDWIFEEFENILGNVANSSSGNVSAAISYAKSQTEALLSGGADNLAKYEYLKSKEKSSNGYDGILNTMNGNSGWNGHERDHEYKTSDYIGITMAHNYKDTNGDVCMDGASVSITNIAKAYLTYFAQAMEGLGNSVYNVADTVGNRAVKDSHFIDDQFRFDVVVDLGINTDQGLNSGFYDAMFNQICMRGWLENGEVDDKKYLQEMLQTGKLFLATCTDDGYYYQGNYEVNSYIKEISDDEAIAKAEAKYNTEKQKLNHKEEIIDLKMKNLDTEISSLTTEYDTVKSLISKNIEKGFKRYDA